MYNIIYLKLNSNNRIYSELIIDKSVDYNDLFINDIWFNTVIFKR